MKQLERKLEVSEKKRDWNQDDLISEMSERKNGICRNALSKLENGEMSDIKFSHILTLCNIFDCDIGYLLGDYECRTQDIQFICDKTGLSESAVNILDAFRCDEIVKIFLNGIITHGEGTTVEFLATASAIIRDEYEKILKNQVGGLETHQVSNAIMGYLYECQNKLKEYIKDDYMSGGGGKNGKHKKN